MGGRAPREYRLAVVGHGFVGRALETLLGRTRTELAARHGLAYRTTVVATRRAGVLVAEAGVGSAELAAQLAQASPPADAAAATEHLVEVLSDPATPYDVLVELSTASPLDGRPAFDHLTAALNSGRHAVTANKGPVAWHAAGLARLSAASGAQLRYEAALMDCLPVMAIRTAMVPVGRITAFAGILNSTTNHLLTALAGGTAWADAVGRAQHLGIAESDLSIDVEGHDASLKAVMLANLLFEPGRQLTPAAVARQGIAGIDQEWPERALAAGNRVRLVARGEAGTDADPDVRVHVRPEELAADDPLAHVDGTSMGLQIDSVYGGRLELALAAPGVEQTAYAVLMDLVALGATDRGRAGSPRVRPGRRRSG